MKKISLLIVIIVFLSFCSCDVVSLEDEENITRINDINMFINEEYAKNNSDSEAEWWQQTPGRGARKFFPFYNEIEYEYSDINFYVYAYAGISYPDATFVLELKFDDVEKYKEAKADIYTTYDFLEKPVNSEMPSCEYNIGNYLVKIITEGEEEDYFPHMVYAICENDNENIIRYLFVYSQHQDAIQGAELVNGVKKRSNCEW